MSSTVHVPRWAVQALTGSATIEEQSRARQRLTAALAESASRPQASRPATLVRGVVEMSLRGASEDVERLVKAMRDMGIAVWRVPVRALQDGRAAGYEYFSVEVPRDTDA